MWDEFSNDKVSKTEASIVGTAKTNVFPFCVSFLSTEYKVKEMHRPRRSLRH